MASITRDRGCLYYVPWIATLCVCLGIAALGVWAEFTRRCKTYTIEGLEEFNIQAKHVDRINGGLIATAVTYLVIALLIFLMSLWRSFIEAAHDAIGLVARGALSFMVISYIVNTAWFTMVLWLVLLIMANTMWGALLYLVIGAIDQAVEDIGQYGTATWLPSRTQPCPGQCLDLTTFVFVTSELKDACICDVDKLNAARYTFDRAYDIFTAVAVGNWVMLVAGICLLVNFACQFSHTKRERELLSRIASKAYSGI